MAGRRHELPGGLAQAPIENKQPAVSNPEVNLTGSLQILEVKKYTQDEAVAKSKEKYDDEERKMKI